MVNCPGIRAPGSSERGFLMVCDLTPRPGELWQSATTAHAWLVRVLKVSRNSVTYTQIAGPASRRNQVHRMSLPAFQRCYWKAHR